jgi:hypothetical protein
MQQDMSIAGKPRRASIFREVGLLDDNTPVLPPDFYSLIYANASPLRPAGRTPPIERIDEEDEIDLEGKLRWDKLQDAESGPRTRLRSGALVFQIAVIVLVIFCLNHFTPLLRVRRVPFSVIDKSSFKEHARFASDGLLHKRANSPTDVCKRWSHQSAVVNGTLYIYGGQSTTSSSQTTNTWGKCFLGSVNSVY